MEYVISGLGLLAIFAGWDVNGRRFLDRSLRAEVQGLRGELQQLRHASGVVAADLVGELRSGTEVEFKKIEAWRDHFDKRITDLNNRFSGQQIEAARSKVSWKR
jgi:hypothetical protein